MSLDAQLRPMINQALLTALAARDAGHENSVDKPTISEQVARRIRASHSSECTFPDFMKVQPQISKAHKGVDELDFNGIEKLELSFRIRNFLWKSKSSSPFELALLCGRMFPEESDKIEKYVGGLPDMIHGSVVASKPKTMQEATEMRSKVMDKRNRHFAATELKCKALADLGASINLMPFSVYTKLGLPALQSTRMTLELANCSLCVPKGIARDVLVPVGGFNFPADFVVVDFECNYRVPLILGRPFLRTARVLIDVHGEELVIRDGMERIVFKPDGSQDKESIHMMDIYDDRVKDVCEPKSNDDSPTSTIVEEFESLLGDIIRQKEEVKGISDPVARRKACFKIMNQGRVIHSPKKASISAMITLVFPTIILETSFKMGDEDLNFSSNKELDKEDLIPIPRESKIGKECDFPPSFIPFEGSEMILEEEIDEFLKHDESLNMDLNDEFNDEDDDIIFLEKLLEDENFFEMNDKKVEFLERKTKEDFETKDEPKKKKELQVFHPDIEILNHFETTSYVGSDYVFYEDFNLVEVLPVSYSTGSEDKVFKPGIFDNDAFKDKSSKELAPSKALLTLDVFDPLHPPLMDFHVTKAFSEFTFSLLKIFSKKFSGFWKLHGSILWKDKAIPTISIDGLQSSLHKWENSNLLS
ncbi:reverse transcriptase domain-containing protein, partial [Tanacetum coccineum]